MRVIVGLLLLAALGAACSGSPTNPSADSGTLRLMLRDSPFADAKAVLVTFSEVTAHRDTDAGFTRVPFAEGAGSRTCDLKKLETAQDLLGVGMLPAGRYTQVRLHIASAALYFDNPSLGAACAPSVPAPAGRNAPLEIPSGEVRLNREFPVPEGGTTTMLLDFDGERSIRETGNGRYLMTPVITVLSVQ